MLDRKLRRLAFINRQPTLFRHSAPCVEILPSEDDDEENISLSHFILPSQNADFDGDTEAIYVVHDEDALKEMRDKAFIQNYVFYDHSHTFLAVVRHESLYCCYYITLNEPNMKKEVIEINDIEELKEGIDWYNNELDHPIKFKDKIYSYGRVLLNKWIGASEIIVNRTIDKKQANYLSEVIYNLCNKIPKDFYDRIHELNKKLLVLVSCTNCCPSLDISSMIELVDDDSERLFQLLPDRNVQLGFHINEGIINRCLNNFDHNSTLYKLFKSGSRFNKTQLARSCINIGYLADSNNKVIQTPIKSNLLYGLSEYEFFLGSSGTRKGISDKDSATPQSGYLERSLAMALSPVEIAEEDCGCNEGIEVELYSKSYATSLVDKYFRINKDEDWRVFTLDDIEKYLGKTIEIRSPILCNTKNLKICKKCFGEKSINSIYVGVVAAQCMTEVLTQLTLRTFHTSGNAEISINKEVASFIEQHLTDIENTETTTKLYFDTKIDDKIKSEFGKIEGFISNTDTEMLFDNNIQHEIENNDTVKVIKEIKLLMNTRRNDLENGPIVAYKKCMELLSEVSSTYSSYVEIVFCNMFLTDIEKKEFWRYHRDKPIVLKLSEKSLPRYISPLLGLLYTPNNRTISSDDFDINFNTENNEQCIHEIIWSSKF